MSREIELPELVRNTVDAQGHVGKQWQRELPAVVDELARRWVLTVGATLAGGTAAYVAEATTARGERVVLKVHVPTDIERADSFLHRVRTFQLADGRGCARLLAHDERHLAMLLEGLGPNVDSLGLPVRDQLTIIATTVQHMWVPVPADVDLPTGAEHARWLADFIQSKWEELGRPCAARTIDTALTYAAERAAAFDRASAVLVHGDAHSWNTLVADAGRYKLVDPEGFVSEPAHDLGIPMREMHTDLLAGDAKALGRERAHLLGALTGVDPEAIWQWGFVERVSTGLYAAHLGESFTRDFLAVADAWSA